MLPSTFVHETHPYQGFVLENIRCESASILICSWVITEETADWLPETWGDLEAEMMERED